MKRYPSVDRIESVCGVDRATAIKIRRVIDGRDDPLKYGPVAEWWLSCYHEPRKLDAIEHAVDHLLSTHGIEAISADSGAPWSYYYGDIVALYCNTGDSYGGTMLYDIERGVWYATSWADWVETAERNRRYTFR